MSEAPDGAAEAVTEDTTLAPQVEAEGEQPGEDAAAAADDEGEAPQPKPKKTAQERISELTAARREAEREAEYWRSRATQPVTHAAPAAEEGKPDPANYADGVYDPAYIDALTDFKAEQAIEKRFSQREAQSRVQSAVEAFDAKVAAEYPDGEPAGIIALRRAPAIPQTIVDLVTASEIGPKLAEHLGDNLRELDRLSAMPPHLQGREIAKIEARLMAPPRPNPATNAPPATPQVRGAGGRFAPGPRDEQPIEDWLAARNSQLGR